MGAVASFEREAPTSQLEVVMLSTHDSHTREIMAIMVCAQAPGHTWRSIKHVSNTGKASAQYSLYFQVDKTSFLQNASIGVARSRKAGSFIGLVPPPSRSTRYPDTNFASLIWVPRLRHSAHVVLAFAVCTLMTMRNVGHDSFRSFLRRKNDCTLE